nr:hypothetical protein [Tanacetum cinerariifolium]
MPDNRTMAQLLQAPTVRACPHHGFFELQQLDTFYNALNVNDQDSLNFAAGGYFLDKMLSDCLKIIESKSKVRQSRAKAVVAKVNSSSSTPAISSDVAELKDMVRELLPDKKNQSSAPAPSPTPAPIKAVESNYVTCGVLRSIQSQGQSTQTQLANLEDMMSKFMSSNMASSSGSGTLPCNTITNPKENLKGITTRSGVAYQGPTIPTPSKDQVQTPSSQSTAHVQPPVTQSETPVSVPVVAPISASMPNLKPSIPYPSRRDNERHREQANEQIKKFYEIFKDMSFEISFADALILMPKFACTLKALIGIKEKLSEMARTPMNEHSLADLGASINLMPLSVWKELSLPELTLTCMTLELADCSVSKPIDIAKDVKVKVGIPTPFDNPIVSTTYPTLIPFEDSDFLLFEEANAFLSLEDDPDSPKLDHSYYDLEGDILMLEAILNSDPAPSFPNHEQSVPSFKNELKACEAKMIKSSVDEPPEVELPPYLEYTFLEGDNKLPVIIAKELGDEEKAALIKVLKSHKRAIAWKLSDI